MNEAEIRRSLRDWLSAPWVRDDTPLLEQKVLTSLQLMDLLLHVEQLRGRPIEVESLKPGAFHSIDALWSHFFGATDD
jgi:hypothetical protein